MDSPLLPTMHRQPDVTASPTGLMADLSLASSTFSPGETYHHASSSRSHSHSRSSPSSDEDTPQKPRRSAAKAKPRFSLFATSQPHSSDEEEEPQPPEIEREDENERDELAGEGEGVEEHTIHARPVQTSAEREDKLRESLYELRGMNEVFDGFLGALEAARGHNEVRTCVLVR